MAQKKSGGSSKNGRDSKSKNLGIKKFYNHFIKPGEIIIRQKGGEYKAGLNTIISKDYTIISLIYGYVFYKKKNKKKIVYVF